MTINKRPATAAAIDDFIGGAPDASLSDKTAPKRVRKGKKVQISFTLTEPLLDRVDEQARAMSLSRAAFINLALFNALDR